LGSFLQAFQELADVDPTTKIGIELDRLPIGQQKLRMVIIVGLDLLAQPVERRPEALAGSLLVGLGPEEAGKLSARLRSIAVQPEVGQQLGGLLRGQRDRLAGAGIDLRRAEEIDPEHTPPLLLL